MQEIMKLTALQLGAAIRRGEVSPTEAVKAALERIEETAGDNAFTEITAERALERAAWAEKELAAGRLAGPLAGVPMALKDNICTRGVSTTCASRILAGFRPPYDATLVERLEGAGAVSLGKLNMDEFAMGSTSETSFLGPVRNPWDRERVPGGSSGGAAAAVAARSSWYAIGSDTGGSIRQPAAFCGVTGIKPTYGTVSRYGLIAYASSLDQMGPLARDAADCAAVLDLVMGRDPRDGTSLDVPAGGLLAALTGDVRGLRIGLPRECFGEGLDSAVRACVLAAADVLRELYQQTRTEGFGPEVRWRILLGTFVLSSGYYDAYYLKALRAKGMIKRAFDEAFCQCDVMLTPTAPAAAPRLGESLSDPLRMYLSDIDTVPVNLAGLPGLSMPCGFDETGLPVGAQLIGPPLGEKNVLNAAHAFQMETDWHTRAPAEKEVG